MTRQNPVLSDTGRLPLALVILAVAAWAAGCGGEKGTDPPWNPPPIVFPLEPGSRWTYSRQDRSAESQITPGVRVDTLLGTTEFRGAPYAVIASSPAGLFDTTWVRQDGQAVWFVAPLGIAADSVTAFLEEALRESFPWKVLDFAAGPGTEWVLMEKTRDWVTSEGTLRLAMNARAGTPGRTTVAVPAGDYQNVYHGWLTYALEGRFYIGGLPAWDQAIQVASEIFVADGVGIVLQATSSELRGTGNPPTTTSVRDELTTFFSGP